MIPEEIEDLFVDALVGARKIFIYGAGRSGLAGQFFAVRLVQLGLDVHFVGDMTTPIVSDKDVTIIISNTGETMSAVQTANISRRLGSYVIGVTSEADSKLAHASNLVIYISQVCNGDKKDMAPLGTLFEDSVVLFFDSLIPSFMDRLKQDESAMRQRHAIWV
ncbi:MAG TPA: SIS domain-containing protein [Candidatus Methanomethylophilaceae archaeon]|nr:SIS domain-containing protein [Candidatus Methanomethylophilaceae archaeon]